MKITLLYQVSHYIRVKKQRNIKRGDQQSHLVIRGFCYIRPLYNEVPLYWDTMAVFTWEQITFRKTFRIGIVIWTMCVHMHCKRLPNHDQDLRTARWYFTPTDWPIHGFSAHFQNAHAQITFQKSFAFTCPRIKLSRWITIQNALFFAFQNAFQKPDLKELCVHKG